MKKILFFAMLGMSTIGFSQVYRYTSFGVANGLTTYSVPDANADVVGELLVGSGQKFSKFDLAVSTFPSTPADDLDKTFGNNNPTPTDNAGTDTDRGWTTTTAGNPTILPSVAYYSCVRQVAAVQCPRGAGLWAYHTVNFAEAGNFNPIMRFRDGTKTNIFVVSIYSPSNMATPIYNETIDLTGVSPGGTSTDGKAKYLTLNGTTGNGASVWYKILTAFTAPSAGDYVVKISQTTVAGSCGFGSFTFWKEAAATAPEVTITAPLSNSVFEQGSTISLSAKTTVGDGTITGVEFFDGAISLGMGTDAGGGVYTKDIIAGTSVAYNFKAVATETGGVAPDTGESLIIKTLSIGLVEDNFNGSTYPGKPWNNTMWAFGTDNAVNFAVGGAIDRVVGVDKYMGVPNFAYDLGAVNNTFDKPSTSLRYVAGSTNTQSSVAGVDARLANKGANSFSFSDDYSRTATNVGAGRFLNNVDFNYTTGGAWARYSCKFVAGKYKLIMRASDNCAGNYNIYARFLKADGTVLGTGVYTFNAGQVAPGCASELNVTKLAGIPAYTVLTTPTLKTQWIMVNDELSLEGDVIVELSDPDPVLGGNSPAGGAYGEFTFEYVGSLSTANFKAADFKVYTNNRTLNVVAESTDAAIVKVFDISGRQIISKSLVNGAMFAELPAAGIYIVKVQAKDKNAKTMKVVVK